MAIGKSESNIDGWEVITAAGLRLGADHDVSAVYQAVLAIAVARVEAVAHANGALITVEVRFGTNDAGWRILTAFRSTKGTVSTIDVDASSASGGTTLSVSATANFETLNDKYFVKDNTISSSEIVRNNGFSSNDFITTLDNLDQTHANTADVYTKPDEFVIAIPDAASTVRVIIWNDDADCDIATKTDIIKLTGI